MTEGAQSLSEEVTLRRTEELAALQAYYDDALLPSLTPPDNQDEPAANIAVQGPWFIRLGNQSQFGLGIPTLEIRLPSSYPFGNECPIPILHNVMMKPQVKEELLQELQDMYEVDMDVGIMWGERCREEFSMLEDEPTHVTQQLAEDEEEDHDHSEGDCCCGGVPDSQRVQTFIPPTTRYNQPIRHFAKSIIHNPDYQREILHTDAFHPPKSGAAENMIAHVCEVTCIEHVQWALAELLFNDKKVAKATHNMFAYRFHGDDSTLVHDNDDDGEKGSGAKLSSLLELSGAQNVLVVVSRWYGGQQLGPARFKWIAAVARTGLVQGGFITD